MTTGNTQWTIRVWIAPALMMLAALLAGCGGSGGAADAAGAAAGGCDPKATPVQEDCGTVYLALTDAPGDFLQYSVEVVALSLRAADGRIVDALPATSRVDFAEYVELTEFVTAATVPPGRYVEGTLRLDYGDAEILVENADGDAVPAVVTDASGAPLGEVEVAIRLRDRRALEVRRGLPSLLLVDFDLAASHTVDLGPPATAVAEPFIVADIDPVDEKSLRVRGPLVAVNPDEGVYAIALRPFRRSDGDFGSVRVMTRPETAFEIDGAAYLGEAGLEAMAALTAGTPTLAFGTLDVANREFTAEQVYAGNSVPGAAYDGVRGNVVARDAGLLRVTGVTVARGSARATFNDSIDVLIGPETRVRGWGEELSAEAISVGQRVAILGNLSGEDDAQVLDATSGIVQLRPTRLAGLAGSVQPGLVVADLQSIDGRRISLFDFSGTGSLPELDAEPSAYEIDTGALDLVSLSPGEPFRATGKVSAYGYAPPDFTARSVIDPSETRAGLLIGWGESGTTSPFLSADATGLVIDTGNPDLGDAHHLLFAGIRVDLLGLPQPLAIVPQAGVMGLYAIAEGRRITVYADYAAFVEAVLSELGLGKAVRGMAARGAYDAAATTLASHRVMIRIE